MNIYSGDKINKFVIICGSTDILLYERLHKGLYTEYTTPSYNRLHALQTIHKSVPLREDKNTIMKGLQKFWGKYSYKINFIRCMCIYTHEIDALKCKYW